MAFIKQISDKIGNDYLNSYWNISDITISPATKTMSVNFLAFKDKDSRESEKLNIPGQEKTYSIAGPEFNKIYDIIYPVIAPYFYEHAKQTKDISLPENNPDGTPVQVSFFEDSADELEIKITDKEIVLKSVEEVAAAEKV